MRWRGVLRGTHADARKAPKGANGFFVVPLGADGRAISDVKHEWIEVAKDGSFEIRLAAGPWRLLPGVDFMGVMPPLGDVMIVEGETTQWNAAPRGK